MRELSILLFFFILTFGNLAHAQLKSDDRSVCSSKHCYFIKQGYIYEGVRPKAGEQIRGHYMSSSRDVKKLILFKDKIVAIQNDGDVYVSLVSSETHRPVWVQIAEEGKKLFADKDNLYLITKKGKLLVHDGDLSLQWYELKIEGEVWSRFAENVFYDSEQSAVVNLSEKDGALIIHHSDGSKTDIYGYKIAAASPMGEKDTKGLAKVEKERNSLEEKSLSGIIETAAKSLSIGTGSLSI